MAVAALGGKCTGRQFSEVKLCQWALLQGTIFQGAICCGATHQKGGGGGESTFCTCSLSVKNTIHRYN